jgi:CheY-like chemotaxis protein
MPRKFVFARRVDNFTFVESTPLRKTMNKTGPIIIIDDDTDDQELLRELFTELQLKNDFHIFPDGEAAITFLNNSNIYPFLIISDIKMPKMDGFELRELLSSKSERLKTIPFLFFTTGSTPQSLNYAYSLSVQGIFQKPVRYSEWKTTMQNIVQYWTSCMGTSI